MARGSRSSLDLVEQLQRGAATLGVSLGTSDAARLIQLIEELERWNRAYNLTAVADLPQMLTHHLLDSLAINPDLVGERIADAGTGAGFPGLPLALLNPGRKFTLIDSTAKKLRFVAHAAQLLGLANVTPLHARVEAMRPEVPFDTVVARALAPLPQLLKTVRPLCGATTRVLAMKGKRPSAEIAAVKLPWRILGERELEVPGLGKARCVITLGLLRAQR
jgi:16S rRNA (guanine527-N7)-methyltransferase